MALPYGRLIAQRELPRLIRQSEHPDELTGMNDIFDEYAFQRGSREELYKAVGAYLGRNYTGGDSKIVKDTLFALADKIIPGRSFA